MQNNKNALWIIIALIIGFIVGYMIKPPVGLNNGASAGNYQQKMERITLSAEDISTINSLGAGSGDKQKGVDCSLNAYGRVVGCTKSTPAN